MVDFIQFLLEIGAVFIGAFFAFEFDNYRENQDKKKQSISILKLLKHELEVDAQYMVPTIRDNVENMKVPFAPLSLAIWEAVSNKIEMISKDNALRAISNAYYNMHTLEKALDRFQTQVHIYESASDKELELKLLKRLEETREVILTHIREPTDQKDRPIVVIIREALTEIDKEIQRLDS